MFLLTVAMAVAVEQAAVKTLTYINKNKSTDNVEVVLPSSNT